MAENSPEIRICGNRPNCVSSMETRKKYKIDPIDLGNIGFDEFVNKIKNIESATLESSKDGFAHFTFRSKWFRFVDDVHLLYKLGTNSVEISSRSRVGYSDRGVNRKRVEHLRSLTQGS